jgi:hypothetical protein
MRARVTSQCEMYTMVRVNGGTTLLAKRVDGARRHAVLQTSGSVALKQEQLQLHCASGLPNADEAVRKAYTNAAL